MIGIAYSESDPASRNMAEHLIKEHGFEEWEMRGERCWRKEHAILWRSISPLISAEEIDDLGFDCVYFLSRHKSAEGVPALTTHSLGNWGREAKLGGKPGQLSFAAPMEMLGIIKGIEGMDSVGFEKTYEATHHGPLMKTPSLFVELGGDERSINSKMMAQRLADKVDAAIFEEEADCSKVVMGIGGTHYPRKFTMLAIGKGYAFSHIMPRYAILNPDGSDNLSVLELVLERSSAEPEAAVVEWRSLSAVIKERVLNKLGEIGLDHERA
ncbi:MAG: hypothetical protein KGH54_01240 [Candidatus Micrarchaeota archaeon]|nr:hypothetical protein [Candidatus Micrarchaeota archaeon]